MKSESQVATLRTRFGAIWYDLDQNSGDPVIKLNRDTIFNLPFHDKDSFANLMRLKTVMGELATSGPISIERVARRLGTSPRTFQRHLASQGYNFRRLLDETRFEIARTLLCQTELDVQQIAMRLGYRAPSGFTRAFRRWTGCAPNAYRKMHNGLGIVGKKVARNGQNRK